VTTGRSCSGDNNIDILFFRKNNIPIVSSARGGGATFHSPGQLVLYPVIDLGPLRKSISFYIDFLERSVSLGLNRMGVPVTRVPGRRGVWLENRKIAFTGVAVKKWVTYHGVSVNINNDIDPFFHMNPCGEEGIAVTSVKAWSKREADMASMKEALVGQFMENFEREYGDIAKARDQWSLNLTRY
jgi:lipoate-protein ligase B